jgi:hypothetical protein
MLLLPTSLNTEIDTTAEKAGTKPLSGIICLIMAVAFSECVLAKAKLQSMVEAELWRRGFLSSSREGKGESLLFPL